MFTIYIIEDEDILRDLFIEFLKSCSEDVTIVGSCGDSQRALEDCIRLQPDLAIVDIRLPEVNGLEILHSLKMRLPETRVLIFTGTANTQAVRIAVEGRADGFIEKAAGLEQLGQAIRTIRDGGQFFTPEVYRQILTFRVGGVPGKTADTRFPSA